MSEIRDVDRTTRLVSDVFFCSNNFDGYTLPAEIYADGTKKWYKNGQPHREDKDKDGNILPAEVRSNWTKKWYVDGNEVTLSMQVPMNWRKVKTTI